MNRLGSGRRDDVESQVDFAAVLFVPLYICSVGRYGAFVAGWQGQVQGLAGGIVGDAEMNAKLRPVYGGIAVLVLFEGIGRQLVWPIRQVAIDFGRRAQTVGVVVIYNRTMDSAESE